MMTLMLLMFKHNHENNAVALRAADVFHIFPHGIDALFKLRRTYVFFARVQGCPVMLLFMVALRELLPSDGWAMGMSRGGVADRNIAVEGFAESHERLQLIWAQMVAFNMLTEIVTEMHIIGPGIANAPNSLNDAIYMLRFLLPVKDVRILRAVNRKANDAKHSLLRSWSRSRL